MFDVHARAFAFWGGACERGIYDNMKTAVDAVFVGPRPFPIAWWVPSTVHPVTTRPAGRAMC